MLSPILPHMPSSKSHVETGHEPISISTLKSTSLVSFIVVSQQILFNDVSKRAHTVVDCVVAYEKTNESEVTK